MMKNQLSYIYSVPKDLEKYLGGAQLMLTYSKLVNSALRTKELYNGNDYTIRCPIDLGFQRNIHPNSLYNLVKTRKIEIIELKRGSIFITAKNNTSSPVNIYFPRGSIVESPTTEQPCLVTTEWITTIQPGQTESVHLQWECMARQLRPPSGDFRLTPYVAFIDENNYNQGNYLDNVQPDISLNLQPTAMIPDDDVNDKYFPADYSFSKESSKELPPSHDPFNEAPPTHDPFSEPSPSCDPFNEPSLSHDPFSEPLPSHNPFNEPSLSHDPFNKPSPTHDPFNKSSPTHDPFNKSSPSHDSFNEPSPSHDSFNEPSPSHDPFNELSPSIHPVNDPSSSYDSFNEFSFVNDNSMIGSISDETECMKSNNDKTSIQSSDGNSSNDISTNETTKRQKILQGGCFSKDGLNFMYTNMNLPFFLI